MHVVHQLAWSVVAKVKITAAINVDGFITENL